MKSILKYYFQKLYHRWNYDVQKTLLSNGRILSQLNASKSSIQSLEEVEFQVFSQRGEDGILQYIFNKIEVPNKVFVEFGVENYTESNTRFLLINNNWSGLVIDGSERNIKFIKSDYIHWKYDLTAVHSFITRENINQLIGNYTKIRDIGLLSVDIDGNDYWVWDAISVIEPRVVVCEYNSAFGAKETVSVPYKGDFTRRSAHYSDLYFGASCAAFCHLAEKKGYVCIGTAGAGVNVFFVRKDLAAPFKIYTPEQAYRESQNRDSRNADGSLSFLRHTQRLEVLKSMPVVDVVTGQEKKISELSV